MDNQENEASAAWEDKTRHKVGIDCLSLLDDDGQMPSAEEVGIGNFNYKEIIKSLSSDREKFIVLCLDNGYQNTEIGFMLNIHPSRVSHIIRKIRIELVRFKKARM